MSDYKGGYQILDLTGATAGDPVTIVGIFNKIESNKGKPILVKANDGQRVFAQAKEVDGDYVITYLSAEGKTIKVVITDEDSVTTTIADEGASIEALTQAVNEINSRVDADTIGEDSVNLYIYDGSTAEKIFTCPSDGYVYQNCGSVEDGASIVDCLLPEGAVVHLNCVYGANGSQVATFVKKGMKLVRNVSSSASCSMSYRPLS